MVNFLYTLVLLGSIQGLIICAMLLFPRKKPLSNRLFAAIIGLLSLPGFHLYLHFTGAYEINMFMQIVHDIIPMVVIMPIGPLIYFYVRSLNEAKLPAKANLWLHFLPTIIDLLPKLFACVFYLWLWAGHPLGARESYIELDNAYNKYADIPRWLAVSCYIIAAYRYLNLHVKLNPLAGRKSLPWITQFLKIWVGFQIVWFIYLVPYTLENYSKMWLEMVNWFPLYIPMTVMVYWLGIQGYLISLKLSGTKKNNAADWIDAGWERLTRAMEKDRLYLDPTLNLEKIAEHISLSPRQVSELLNQHKSVNFNNFMNQYRLEEFKSRLSSLDLDKFTIVGLAFECGFSSAPTFQRIFKTATGMSPSSYLKTIPLQTQKA